MTLKEFLTEPDSYEDRPLGYAQNQIGHALLGWFFVWAFGPIAMAFYAVWEIVQVVKYGAQKHDAVEDMSFFTVGAFADPIVTLFGVAFLITGILRRMEARDATQ